MQSPCVNPTTNVISPLNDQLTTINVNYSGQELRIDLLENKVKSNSRLYIYNTIGRLVASTPITQAKTTINSNLPTGIYFYKLLSTAGSQKGKFIVK